MRKVRTLLGIGIAGAVVSAGVPGVALAAPTAPYTVLTVDIGATGGSPVTKSGVYDSSNARMYAYGYGDAGVFVQALTSDGIYVTLTASPPQGQRFVVGQTYETRRSWDSTHAGLDVSGGGVGCNEAFGSLTVKQTEDDPTTGKLAVFAAAYEFHCETNPAGVHGEVRWNSDVEYTAAVTDPSPVRFDQREVDSGSQARTVTVTSAGSVPVTFGTAGIAGRDAADFTVTDDNCSGRTLAPGVACTVTVLARPSRAGGRHAALELPDSSTFGKTVAGLLAAGVDGVRGTYYSLTPKRLMDTRSGLGAPKAKLNGGKKVDLQVTGRGGVPSSGVGAVVLNVTVVNPTSGSFLTVWPAGRGRPNASSVNFPKSWLGSNNVTVQIGAGGKVSVYNHTGSTDVVVDVVGFYASDNTLASRGMGGHFHPIPPKRLFDTRSAGQGALPGGYYLRIWQNYATQELNDSVRGFVLNVTAVNPSKSGFLTAWNGTGDVPNTSTVNYAAGKVVPNLTIVEASRCYTCVDGGVVPSFGVYSSQKSHVVVDLVGVIGDGTIEDGLRFTPLEPTRILDSRIGQGTPSALGPNVTRRVVAPSTLVDNRTRALAMNVTGVAPSTATVLTVWPADTSLGKPATSNLNPAGGQTVANAVLTEIGPEDAFQVHNLSGTANVLADVVGTFYLYPGTASTASAGATAAGPTGYAAGRTGAAAPRQG
ncbi:hypothetical protein GA0070616_2498 [Micromonospora nigra]|uniref:Choice-of-anchor D domain-containing protein n=1 Tax=Micromonospora nigra TaxID=145857 RepID=A0A1C6RYW6_9ACTN|nr:choice-of-anchor D domain-containing protein [Micromonospora nigra]SCL22233.1 hypothetical protein GA0070616_2498 [Micromonospora nigra]